MDENTKPPKLSAEELEEIEKERKRVEAVFRKAHGIPADVPYDAGAPKGK